jgi:hypothetical protein
MHGAGDELLQDRQRVREYDAIAYILNLGIR